MTNTAPNTHPSIFAAFLVIASLCWAAAATASAAPAIDRAALAELARGDTADAPRLAGVAVARFHAGRVVAAAAGAAELAADGATLRPLRPGDPLRVASISKLVTALVALRLVEAGRLDLDRDARDYGLALRNPLSPAAPVTLRMLLGHRAGLRDGDRATVPPGGRTLDILGDGGEKGGATWAAPAGLRFEYSNAGYGLAAAVIEAAAGERFDRLARRLVLAPLRLDAGFNWFGVGAAGRAAGATLYRRDATGSWVAQVDAPAAPRPASAPRPACPAGVASRADCDLTGYRPGANGFLFSPQGGLRVSVVDLARLGGALLRPRHGDAAPGPRALLGPAAWALLWRVTPTAAGSPPVGSEAALMRGYGLGFQCLLDGGRPGGDQPLSPVATRWCGHLGEAYGLTAGLWIDRAAGRAFAYAVTGAADDPARHPGRVSRFQAWEEALLRLLASPDPSLSSNPPRADGLIVSPDTKM